MGLPLFHKYSPENEHVWEMGLAAFATPIFVTGQRFATKECPDLKDCPGVDNTEYWVLIAGIIAYVAGITLVVWLPIKIFVVWKKVIRPYEGLWFPGNLLYILFSSVPCVAFVLLGHEHCVANGDECFDYFRGAPIETFVIMLVVTDWSEKIRYIKLRSSEDLMRKNKYTNPAPNRGRSHDPTGYADADAFSASRRSSISQRSLLHSSMRKGTLGQRLARGLKWTDARPENLLRDVMLAYDIRLLLGLTLLYADVDAGTTVFQTTWVYPIYILSAISFLPLVFAPNSDMRSSMTVFLQDIPFFIFRIVIFSKLGSDLVLGTSVLFLLKNLFVALAFFYFNVIVPWRNERQEKNEYELRRVSENPRRNYNIPPQEIPDHRMDAPAYPAEVDDHNAYIPAIGGIHNPAYQSRRYESSPQMRRHNSVGDQYQDAEWDEPTYQETQITPVQARAMYVSHHTAAHPQPQLARVESVVHRMPEEYSAYHNPPQHDQRFADDPHAEHLSPSPPQQPPKDKKVIDYDTLNDPNSFLYNQDDTPKRTKVFEIDFEGPSHSAHASGQQRSSQKRPPGTSETPQNKPPDAELPRSNESEERPQVSAKSPVEEQPYAQIDYTKKSTRRKAPPPPTKPSTRPKPSEKTTDPDENLPHPPPEILNPEQPVLPNGDIGRSASSKYRPSKRIGSIYTPDVARSIASEMMRRNEDKEAMDAVKALEEATEYGTKIGRDWSVSTTPKSSHSTKPTLNVPVVNDADYDDRL